MTEGLHVVREGEGPPLLFLVGLGGRAEFWAPQFERFADRFDCISFDHRKTGDSKTSVAALAGEAIRLLDALAIDRADVVGHSLGGAVAQHLAVFHPGRVGRVVLSATWAGPTPFFLELFRLRKSVLAACGPRDYLTLGMLLGNPGWWTMTNHSDVTAGIEARLSAFSGVEAEIERMDAVTAHDLRDRVGEIAADTLVICARDDQITPLPLAEELAALIPSARLHVLPAGNHFAPVTVPDDYAAGLEGFLAAQPVAA